jgi:hypothetical protein
MRFGVSRRFLFSLREILPRLMLGTITWLFRQVIVRLRVAFSLQCYPFASAPHSAQDDAEGMCALFLSRHPEQSKYRSAVFAESNEQKRAITRAFLRAKRDAFWGLAPFPFFLARDPASPRRLGTLPLLPRKVRVRLRVGFFFITLFLYYISTLRSG